MVKEIVALPAVPPVTIPVVLPTDAIDELLLVQLAGVVASVSVTVASEHTAETPAIGEGSAFTVTG